MRADPTEPTVGAAVLNGGPHAAKMPRGPDCSGPAALIVGHALPSTAEVDGVNHL